MNLDELFDDQKVFLLTLANTLVSKLNRQLGESKDSPLLLAQQKSLLKFIKGSILSEDQEYLDQMQSYIIDMIVALRSRGVDKAPLSMIVNELNNAGFEMDKQFLITFISSIDGVTEVNPGRDEIVFNTSGPDRGVSDKEAEKEKKDIKKTAAKVAKDNIKKGNEVPNLEKK